MGQKSKIKWQWSCILITGVMLFSNTVTATDQDTSRRTIKLSRLSSFEANRSRRSFEKAVEHYNAGRYYSALEIFRRLKGYPIHRNPQITASYLMTMKCYYQVGNYNEAKDIGREFLSDFSNSLYRDDVYDCFGDIFIQEGRYRLAFESFLKAISETENQELSHRIYDKLIRLSEGFLTQEDAEDLLSLETNEMNRAILTLVLANNLIAKGDPDGAALALFRMDSDLLPKELVDYFKILKKRTYRDMVGSVVIGLVLPLSGYEEPRGKAFLHGLKNAVKEIQQRQSLEIILEVFDNESDNLKTISCIEQLVINPNVRAIIGPISAVNSASAVATVKSYNIPLLIPVSTQIGLSDLGETVFQMNVDLQKQGRYAAEYAISSLGLQTLAILAPADRFGKGLVDGFVTRADELGAQIVAIEWYSGIPVDLSNQFKSLRKIAFELASSEFDRTDFSLELDTIDQTFIISEDDFFPQELVEVGEKTPIDSTKIVLSSIDGIFLPIHKGDINYVGSQFSSYNLDAQILGNVNWYHLDEINQEMIRPHLNKMVVFTDYLLSENDELEFELIKEGLVGDEELRMALYGYDIMLFLSSQLDKDVSKVSLAERLSNTKLFRGSSKLFSFVQDDPRVNSSIHVLQYINGEFIKVSEVNSDTLLNLSTQSP